VKQALKDQKAKRVQPEQPEPLVKQAKPAQLALPELPEPLEPLVKQAQLVQPELLELPEPLELPELLVQQVQRVQPEPPEQLEQQVREQPEPQVQQVPQAHAELPVLQEPVVVVLLEPFKAQTELGTLGPQMRVLVQLVLQQGMLEGSILLTYRRLEAVRVGLHPANGPLLVGAGTIQSVLITPPLVVVIEILLQAMDQR
jgi:hypothetical protein